MVLKRMSKNECKELEKKILWWFEQNDTAMYQDDFELILVSEFGRDGNLKLMDRVKTPEENMKYWRKFKHGWNE